MTAMDTLEKIFGRTAQMTVLKNLIERPNEPTYLSGIAEETGLSHASVSRVITPLIESGVVQEKLLGKQIRTFKLDMESEATKLVVDFYNKINQIEAEAWKKEVWEIENSKSLMLLGEIESNIDPKDNLHLLFYVYWGFLKMLFFFREMGY